MQILPSSAIANAIRFVACKYERAKSLLRHRPTPAPIARSSNVYVKKGITQSQRYRNVFVESLFTTSATAPLSFTFTLSYSLQRNSPHGPNVVVCVQKWTLLSPCLPKHWRPCCSSRILCMVNTAASSWPSRLCACKMNYVGMCGWAQEWIVVYRAQFYSIVVCRTNRFLHGHIAP